MQLTGKNECSHSIWNVGHFPHKHYVIFPGLVRHSPCVVSVPEALLFQDPEDMTMHLGPTGGHSGCCGR